MDVEKFDYHLPEKLIAQRPLSHRDQSRLLVYSRREGWKKDDRFHNLIQYVKPGDALVINETRVRKARLYGRKANTGGKVEVLLLNPCETPLQWHCLIKPGRRVQPGTKLSFGSQEEVAEVLSARDDGSRVLAFTSEKALEAVEEEVGALPLPPYIKEELSCGESYQTVYGVKEGSVAASTAGLHFTEELLDAIKDQGVEVIPITLHIGLGTFRPVQTRRIEDHVMHKEFFSLSQSAARTINTTREKGGRVLAVGTTVVRVLETVATGKGQVHPQEGWTDLFLYPGYRFKVVDGLLTNFHLPRSTLLMMICAFGGYHEMMELYQYAVEKGYRFFSFGDAMLIL